MCKSLLPVLFWIQLTIKMSIETKFRMRDDLFTDKSGQPLRLLDQVVWQTHCFFSYAEMHCISQPAVLFSHQLIQCKHTRSTKVWNKRNRHLCPLTSSCQFSLNHTIWSTMPSREESRVGCNSRCMCMIRLQRHIGAVARIGPGSEAPEWGWAPTELGCCCPDASGQSG